MSQKSAAVAYTKGRLRADTKKLDQAQKATDTSLSATRASIAVDGFSIPIEFPEDKTYLIWEDFPYAATVTVTHSKCSTGTADAVLKINGTALGGGVNSVSTSEDEVSHSTNNAIAVGDDLTLTVENNSSCEDLVYSVRITRTL